jgi:hypothetical protein
MVPLLSAMVTYLLLQLYCHQPARPADPRVLVDREKCYYLGRGRLFVKETQHGRRAANQIIVNLFYLVLMLFSSDLAGGRPLLARLSQFATLLGDSCLPLCCDRPAGQEIPYAIHFPRSSGRLYYDSKRHQEHALAPITNSPAGCWNPHLFYCGGMWLNSGMSILIITPSGSHSTSCSSLLVLLSRGKLELFGLGLDLLLRHWGCAS